MKTSAKYVIFYDVETGDLISKDKKAFIDSALVEVALVVVDCIEMKIIEENSFILQNDYKDGLIYVSQAEEVHGITRAMRETRGIDLKAGYKTIKDCLTKYKNPRQYATLAGHNIMSFDNHFIKNYFEYMGDNIDNYVRFYIDTLQWAHFVDLEKVNYQLSTCCLDAGVELTNAHRALDDTKANALLWIEYLKRLRGQGNNSLGVEKKIRYRETFQLG